MNNRLFTLQEDVFKVLANHKRLEIIQLLQKRPLNVTEMTEMLGLRQSNLSQHLTLLRQHRLLTVRKQGREAYYELADHNIAKAVQIVSRFLQDQYNIEGVPQPDSIFPIVVDPVCGMRLSASEAYDHTEHDGHMYYFCASGCKNQFALHPSKFLQYVH